MKSPRHKREGSAIDLAELAKGATQASDLLKALANENRRLLLCLLAERERSVTELEDMLKLRQPTVSQQLTQLRADDLVSTRRVGKAIYYALASEQVRLVMDLLYEMFCDTGGKGAGKPKARTRVATR